MRRRDFIKTTTALTGSFLVSRLDLNATAQAPPKIRKSITELSPDARELATLKSAVTKMRDLNKSGDPKSWHAQATIHQRRCPHENWWFLPWHRAYLHFFERICQVLSKDDSFALPYWDWTRYPYIPAPFLEQNGPLSNGTRDPESSKQISWESVGAKIVSSVLYERGLGQMYGGRIDDDVQREHSGSGPLESVVHNGVHSAIGGDMLTPCSPEDPLFWVHHCNIDRLWTSWQSLHGGVIPDDKLWGDHKLAEFHDPDSKESTRRVPCLQTVTSAEFIPQYERLESPVGGMPSVPLPAPEIWLGPSEQISVPRGLSKVVISDTHADVRDNKTTFSLQMSREFETMLERAFFLRPDNYQYSSFFVLLVLDSVPFPKSLSTLVRMFLDPLTSGDPLRFDDPAYIKTFSFFAADGDEKHKKTTFAFDITPNIVTLAAAGRRLKNKVEFTLFSLDPAQPLVMAGAVRPAKARIITIG